jgi:hypothetical protein
VIDIVRYARILLLASPMTLVGAPSSAQVGVVIHGRVEDATSRAPVAAAHVLATDSPAAVLTDSSGGFAILLPRGPPLSIRVERYGYLTQSFDLPGTASSSISVLLLEPAPIELAGIDVVEEAPVAELFRDLRRRRNASAGSVMAFDAARLDRLGRVGTAWDLISSSLPRLFECSASRSGLCVPGRGVTFRNPVVEASVLVCVDGRESWGAVSELQSLDLRAVSLVEIFNRGAGDGGIRVYTPAYMTRSARTRRNLAFPVEFGC